MKRPLLIFCLFCFNMMSIICAWGQKCSCESVTNDDITSGRVSLLDFNAAPLNNNLGFFYGTENARNIVTIFINAYNHQMKNHYEEFKGTVIVKKDDECTKEYGGAFSGPYKSESNKLCLVFSNNLFDNLQVKKSEWFVLAHEVGHMLCGHFSGNLIRLTNLNPEIHSLITLLEHNPKIVIKSQFLEYQADFMGVKLLLNTGYNPREILGYMNDAFDKLRKYKPNLSEQVLTSRKRLLEVYLSGPIYPNKGFGGDSDKEFQQYTIPLKDLFKDEKLKDSLTKSEIAISKALFEVYEKAIKKSKKANADYEAGRYCTALNTYQEIDSTLSILYPNTAIYKENQENIKNIKSILQQKSNWNIEAFGGVSLNFPQLTSDKQTVPAKGYSSPTVGLRLSQYFWYKKRRLGIDIRYSNLSFDTYNELDVVKKAIERFDLKQIGFGPYIAHSTSGSQKDTLCDSRTGLLLSFGASLNYNLQTKYTNFLINESPIVKTGWSPSIYVGIGGEHLQRRMKSKYIRAMITFQAQTIPLSLQANTSTKANAWTYQIGIELAFRCWKL